jgi:hypothetical protein
MGMYGTLCRISERQLARITASPERVASLLTLVASSQHRLRGSRHSASTCCYLIEIT